MRLTLALALASIAVAQSDAPPNSQPNPYRTIEKWGKLPEGRTWGSTSAVAHDREGNIWVAERCGANSCAGKADVAPILKFDRDGNLLKSFGAGMFIFPHAILIDRQGNIWVTDGQGRDGKGHQVIKFDPDGKVLMTLGQGGRGGHGAMASSISPPRWPWLPTATSSWPTGTAATPTRASRSSTRTESSSPPGVRKARRLASSIRRTLLPSTPRAASSWATAPTTASRFSTRTASSSKSGNSSAVPAAIYIDSHDVIYVSDSESRERDGYGHHPGWKRGIRVGSAKDGTVTAFIPDTFATPEDAATSGSEGVMADSAGNIFGAEVGQKGIKKYVRK